MHQPVLHHMVISSHRPHADLLLSIEAERLRVRRGGQRERSGRCVPSPARL